jgi:hypothetical protein
MDLVNHPHRPHRAVIRCQAKMLLLDGMQDCVDWLEPASDLLLSELAATLFQSDRYRNLYQQCRSKQEAGRVSDRLVKELVETFRIISERQCDPTVQGLNALL